MTGSSKVSSNKVVSSTNPLLLRTTSPPPPYQDGEATALEFPMTPRTMNQVSLSELLLRSMQQEYQRTRVPLDNDSPLSLPVLPWISAPGDTNRSTTRRRTTRTELVGMLGRVLRTLQDDEEPENDG